MYELFFFFYVSEEAEIGGDVAYMGQITNAYKTSVKEQLGRPNMGG
jgi:hypothetical protein